MTLPFGILGFATRISRQQIHFHATAQLLLECIASPDYVMYSSSIYAWRATLKNQKNFSCILQPGRTCHRGKQWLGNDTGSIRRTNCHGPFLQDLLLPSQKNRWQHILKSSFKSTLQLRLCWPAKPERAETRYLHGHFTHATSVLQGAIRATFQDITSSVPGQTANPAMLENVAGYGRSKPGCPS